MQVDNTVELIDHMGSDLTVVNAARVSFGKRKESFTISDVGLVQYLAKHNHWSPFGHASLQFHIKAPVFVARQLVKHQVGLVWNEISRRYVDDEPEFVRLILGEQELRIRNKGLMKLRRLMKSIHQIPIGSFQRPHLKKKLKLLHSNTTIQC